MDKVTPKPDGFKLNRGRVAPLLQKLNADGIGHMIDGQRVPSFSGATFETRSPGRIEDANPEA
jgi:5-carboxymethyl-2-hydroxymuconic-semialdehyde dehydrogenase